MAVGDVHEMAITQQWQVGVKTFNEKRFCKLKQSKIYEPDTWMIGILIFMRSILLPISLGFLYPGGFLYSGLCFLVALALDFVFKNSNITIMYKRNNQKHQFQDKTGT